MSELYNISSSPHIRAKDTSAKIMLYVIIALLPASIFGVYNFGLRALLLIAVCIASCVASEWIFEKIVHKKSTITDFSAVLTGLLLAFQSGRRYSEVFLPLSLSKCYSEDWVRTL